MNLPKGSLPQGDLPSDVVDQPMSTRDLILREASRLFSHRGYHGTSTREIADAVGVRQPSLFHHFSSKSEIAVALFEYDRLRSPGMRGEPELADAAPPVRLFHAIRREVLVEVTSAYDLRGLYLTPLLDEPEFAAWRAAYENAMAWTARTIREGIASGDFVDQDVDLVVEILDAIMNQAVRWTPEKYDVAVPDDVAALVMRLVLKRPSQLPSIRRAADRELEQTGVSWAEMLATAAPA